MSYTALVSMATTKKKRSFDAAFKLRVVEYMKILVAAASDRANMVIKSLKLTDTLLKTYL